MARTKWGTYHYGITIDVHLANTGKEKSVVDLKNVYPYIPIKITSEGRVDVKNP